MALGQHAARFQGGSHGVLHGTYSYVLQDVRGQIAPTHSVSAGLDYPSVGPEHAWLHDCGRVEYVAVSDDEALAAFRLLSRLEGIIPALESAHALGYCLTHAERLRGSLVIVNLSGRGDKDVEIIRNLRQT
jgi:tryptophan synthase beta subunit